MAGSEPVEGATSDATGTTLPTVGSRTHPLTGAVQGGLWAGAAVLAIGTSYLQGDRWDGVPWWVALLGVLGGGLLLGQAAGFVSWWFTRYVIDAAEVRIDSGVLNRRSRRAAFERIQAVDVAEPLLARVVGLAEVRIELAGGDESRLVVKFLPLDEAHDVRRLLLRRAHGGAADDADPVDALDERDLITRVTPERTMLGALLSLDLLTALAAVAAVLLAAIGFGAPLVLLGGVLPALSWAVQLISRRVVAEWGFTLWRTPHGLRIERGLLSLTSQTIPFARVQGIAVVEPILWRSLGWCRLEVDVAGSGTGDEAARETTLLPIADRALAAALVDELVPELVPESGIADEFTKPAPVRASRRSWPFAPIGWRYRWIDLGPRRATSSTGWLSRRTSSAPHAKVQSIAMRQGPLQRRLGVATVELHTPDGPVDVDAHHLAAHAARDVALQAVGAARSARADAVSAAAGGVLGGRVDGTHDLA